MTFSPDDVERLVREVLARLRAEPATAPSESPALSASTASASTAATAASVAAASPDAAVGVAERADRLVVSQRVVSLAELDGRLARVRTLVVAPGAVVTPALRDELERRGIKLEYVPAALRRAENSAGRAETGATRVVLLALGRRFDPAPLAASLSAEGVAVEAESIDCLVAATDRLAAEVRRTATLGVLCTRHVAAALCLANRHSAVRAVGGADSAVLLAAVEAVGANVVVLDTAAMSLFAMRRVAAAFCRGGVRPCPEDFRARLN